MNDKALKAAIDQFLKNVSPLAHREIEKAIRKSLASGKLQGHETITAGVVLSCEMIDLNVTVYNKIELP